MFQNLQILGYYKDEKSNIVIVGSGTTCKVAQELGRNSVGIDTIEEYTDLAKANLKTKKNTIKNLMWNIQKLSINLH